MMEQVLVVDRIISDVSCVAVAGDMNSLIVTFKMKRFSDGVDKSTKNIRIAYENAAGGTGYDDVANITVVDEEYFTFDWTVCGEALSAAGVAKFAIEVSSLNEYEELDYVWQTCESKLTVLDGIKETENTAVDVDRYYQVLFYENNDNSSTHIIKDDGNLIRIVDKEIIMADIDQNAAIAVKGDINSQILSFTLPRYYKNIDLSEKVISIKFINAKGESDRSRARNVVAEDEIISFTWLLDGNVTSEKGIVQFAIEFIGYNDEDEFYCWSTTTAQFEVRDTLCVDGEIESPGPSWLQSWWLEVDTAVKNAEHYADIAQNGVAISENVITQAQAAATAAENSAKASKASEENAYKIRTEVEVIANNVQNMADAVKAGKSPQIGENGNWFIWDTDRYVDSGISAYGKGYTLTESDKQDIVSDVLDALPAAEEASF